jgi:hypothetical protein
MLAVCLSNDATLCPHYNVKLALSSYITLNCAMLGHGIKLALIELRTSIVGRLSHPGTTWDQTALAHVV